MKFAATVLPVAAFMKMTPRPESAMSLRTTEMLVLTGLVEKRPEVDVIAMIDAIAENVPVPGAAETGFRLTRTRVRPSRAGCGGSRG